MCNNKECFSYYKPYEILTHVFLGDNAPIEAVGAGQITIKIGQETQGLIQNVMHVSHIAKNLLSVSAMTDSGLHVEFARRQECWIHKKENRGCLQGTRDGGLYRVHLETCKHHACVITNQDANKWHQRYGQ